MEVSFNLALKNLPSIARPVTVSVIGPVTVSVTGPIT